MQYTLHSILKFYALLHTKACVLFSETASELVSIDMMVTSTENDLILMFMGTFDSTKVCHKRLVGFRLKTLLTDDCVDNCVGTKVSDQTGSRVSISNRSLNRYFIAFLLH